MVRRSLIVAALLAVSSPLAAQEEYVWTSDRPDADAPLGVTGATVLDAGATEITYRFTQMNSQNVWLGTDSIPNATTRLIYQVAPMTLSHQTHTLMGARGITEHLTLMATAELSVYRRDQVMPGTPDVRSIVSQEALGDMTATAIYQLFAEGPYRLNASLGAVIPIGDDRPFAATTTATEVPLPYDMRPSSGTFGVLPGITGIVQNEVGSLGAQFKGRINIGTGPSDFTFGDRYEANGWAAYRFNEIFSVSAGVRWQIWGDIEGADPRLATLPTDPGSQTLVAGQRADMPVGVNFTIPGNSMFAGQSLLFEAVYALHHDYEGPQLGLDWGINVGWKMGF